MSFLKLWPSCILSYISLFSHKCLFTTAANIIPYLVNILISWQSYHLPTSYSPPLACHSMVHTVRPYLVVSFHWQYVMFLNTMSFHLYSQSHIHFHHLPWHLIWWFAINAGLPLFSSWQRAPVSVPTGVGRGEYWCLLVSDLWITYTIRWVRVAILLAGAALWILWQLFWPCETVTMRQRWQLVVARRTSRPFCPLAAAAWSWKRRCNPAATFPIRRHMPR